MSISYTEVKNKKLHQKALTYGIKEFIHAKIEPTISSQLPFPSDYKYSSCYLPKKYLKESDKIFNFKVRSDDVWLDSFPKCGSTWASNIIWQLQHNLDFSTQFLAPDYMYLEDTLNFDDSDENKDDQFYQKLKKEIEAHLDEMAHCASPRLIKSHLPAHFLPTGVWTVKPKLIYVHRNVKDVAVSMYHMFKDTKLIEYKGSMEDCFDCFLYDHVYYGPFHAHIKSYEQLNHLDHVLILTYEQMLANPFAEIKRISEFLNYTYSDDQLKQLVEYVSFDSMRTKKINKWTSEFASNDYVFVRKGKANGYKDEMSAEYLQKFDEWERQHTS